MKITWICYLHEFTAMGVVAVNVIRELVKLGFDVGLHVLEPSDLSDSYPPEIQQALKKGYREDSVGIFFSYPDIYPSVRCKINIGYTGADSTKWYKSEADMSPAEICNNFMDYMLTPSLFSLNLMTSNGVTIPISLFPHGIDPNIFTLRKLTPRKPFTFLYVGETSLRKGTQDLIMVFQSYFRDSDSKLILRRNTHMDHYQGDEIKRLCEESKNIELIDKNEGQLSLVDLYKNAHCYVYPTRADWFGMTPFEALAVGVPVIATDSNGYYEFLRSCIRPVPSTLAPIENEHPYLKGEWNKTNRLSLYQVMFAAKNEYKAFEKTARLASEYVHREFTWEAVVKRHLLPFLEEVKYKHFEKAEPIKKEVKNPGNYRVTVGIPAKDRGIELALLLQSLLNQSYQEFDVIIYNDCFSGLLNDNATVKSLIKLLKSSGHSVKIIEGKKKGPQYGSQKILDKAKTELIFRVDDDVSLQPSCLEELVETFRNYDGEKELVAAGPIYLNPHEDLLEQILPEDSTKEQLEEMGKIKRTRDGLFISGILSINIHPTDETVSVEHLYSGFMYKKTVAEKVGGYFLNLSPVGHREETDFSYRLFREGYELLVVPSAVAFHFHPMIGGIRETQGSLTTEDNWANDERIFQERMKKWV